MPEVTSVTCLYFVTLRPGRKWDAWGEYKKLYLPRHLILVQFRFFKHTGCIVLSQSSQTLVNPSVLLTRFRVANPFSLTCFWHLTWSQWNLFRKHVESRIVTNHKLKGAVLKSKILMTLMVALESCKPGAGKDLQISAFYRWGTRPLVPFEGLQWKRGPQPHSRRCTCRPKSWRNGGDPRGQVSIYAWLECIIEQ